MEIRKFFSNEEFEKLNEYARTAPYDDIENPADGVVYPAINAAVPDWAQRRVTQRLKEVTGRDLDIAYAFLRLTAPDIAKAPHQAHTDSAMADFTFILYMQDAPPGLEDVAGTSLVKHRTVGGLHQTPWTQAELDIWERDTNRYDQWTITKLYKMERNKAAFYPSKMMHRAEPVGGFGYDAEDGRLVLVAFLNRKGK